MEKEFGEGSIIEVDGKEGLVLSLIKDDEKEYVIVSFDGIDKKIEADAFEVVRNDNRIFFKDVKNEEKKANLMATFVIQVYEEREDN